jgi:hypothetical protein
MSDPTPKPPAAHPLAAVLELVAMQLEVAMQNAAAQAERLSGSVAQFATISARMRATGDPAVLAYCDAIQREAHRAMMAMQYHDQLTQRVTHVREALADVHEGLASGTAADWSALLARMRGHYTMEDERRLFDLVLGSLAEAPARREQESLAGSVELF